MKASEFAVKALTESEHVRMPIIVAMVTDIFEPEGSYMDNPYLYRVVHIGGSRFFVNNKKDLEKIDLDIRDDQIVGVHDLVSVTKTQCPNLDKDSEVYFGELLANFIILVKSFGSAMPFVHGEFSISDIEKRIVEKMPDKISVHQVNDLFPSAIKFMEQLAAVFSFSSTETSITEAPGTSELKEKLLSDKFKGAEKDPVRYLEFEAEMQKHDDKYINSDPNSSIFIRGKIRDIARKKLFLAQGVEAGLGEKKQSDPMTKSLKEGWALNKKEIISNLTSSVSAGFSRGWMTRVAGYGGKTLIRAMNHYEIKKGDCGSVLGVKRRITPANRHLFAGAAYLKGSKWIRLEGSDHTGLDGMYETRSMGLCKSPDPFVCSECAGPYLSLNKNRISSASADIAAALLMMRMKAMHGIAPKTVTYKVNDALL